jgi:flagellar biosynthesis GTPase FlhF
MSTATLNHASPDAAPHDAPREAATAAAALSDKALEAALHAAATAGTPLRDTARDEAILDVGAAREPTRIYRGRTIEELIPKIQAELGADAVVVRRQKGLTGGFAGFFQRPFVEIEARRGTPGIDRYDEDGGAPALPDTRPELSGALPTLPGIPPALTGAPSALPGTLPALTGVLPQLLVEKDAEDCDEFRELTPASLNGAHTPISVLADLRSATDPFAAALAEAEAAVQPAEVVPLETVVQPAQTTPLETVVQPAQTTPPETVVQPAQTTPTETAGQPAQTALTETAAQQPADAVPQISRGRARDAIESALRGVGVGEDLVRELIEAAATHVLPLSPSRATLARAVHTALQQRIPVCAPLPVGSATIAVVGAGGSGKTACCTALKEAYQERSTLPAAQAQITLGATRGELTDTMRRAREEGLMLLDTPAISPSDPTAIRALATLLGKVKPDRVVLALPATLGAKPAAQLLEALRPLGASALAITHADETDQLGVAVEAACAFGVAPVYLLQRGRVGGELTSLDPAHLADRLLPPR